MLVFPPFIALQELIEFAAKAIPQEDHENTFLFIKATAGLRSLEPSVAERVLEEASRVVLQYAPLFKFERDHAKVITGDEEGLFGWIAANALVGALSKDDSHLMGVIDLGGASFQVSAPLARTIRESSVVAPSSEFHARVKVGGSNEAAIYTRSFLGLGAEKAREAMLLEMLEKAREKDPQATVLSDPCLYRGVEQELTLTPNGGTPVQVKLKGASEGSRCREAVSSFVKQTVAKALPLPSVRDYPFVVFSVYHVIRYFLRFEEQISLPELHDKCSSLCSLEWDGVSKEYFEGPNAYPERKRKYVKTYCFKCSYMASLLDDGFGFREEDVKKMRFTDKLGGEELSWTYGAAVSEYLGKVQPAVRSSWTKGAPRNYSSGIVLIAFAALSAFFIYRMRTRRRFSDVHLYRADKVLPDEEDPYKDTAKAVASSHSWHSRI